MRRLNVVSTSMRTGRNARWAGLILVGMAAAAGCKTATLIPPEIAAEQSQRFRVSIETTNYRGWRDAIVMNNGKATAVVVPSIGRVMHFGFVGEESVFWENPGLVGQTAMKGDWATTDWVNLGGDKSWPAPEADWPKWTGRKSWRPPVGFDGLPVAATTETNGAVVLTSEVDPAYGIRVVRRVRLNPRRAQLTIQTVFEKLSGPPVKAGVWVITQLREPVGVYMTKPARSVFAQGWTVLGNQAPPSLRSEAGLISVTRDPSAPYKNFSVGEILLCVV
jgi:hypothetical protein